jgi:hypothetical protein
VELLPELVPEAEILEFALAENLRPMLGIRAAAVAHSYGLTGSELNEALSRVSATLADRAVASILNPEAVKS